MSEHNGTAPQPGYYKRFWQRFSREIGKTWWENVLAIFAVIVVLFCQFYFGWTKKEETVSSALINISPYVAILIAYIARHVVRTPWLLDADRQTEVNSLAGHVVSLNEKLDNLTSEIGRPKFTISKNPTFNDVGEFDQDDRYNFDCKLENTGSRPAASPISRIIRLEEGDPEPKIIENSVANEIDVNEPLIMRLELKCSPNEPPMQIVVALQYKDETTDKIYTQAFFLKWKGIKHGVCSDVEHLTMQEREQVKERLGNKIDDFSDSA